MLTIGSTFTIASVEEKSTCRFKIYLFKRNDILPLQQGKTGCVKKTQFGGISEGNDKVLVKILISNPVDQPEFAYRRFAETPVQRGI
nr:MAG: hypothetical protein EDM05_25750 [Leptolyngbya sp. IPPAS B-1204]